MKPWNTLIRKTPAPNGYFVDTYGGHLKFIRLKKAGNV